MCPQFVDKLGGPVGICPGRNDSNPQARVVIVADNVAASLIEVVEQFAARSVVGLGGHLEGGFVLPSFEVVDAIAAITGHGDHCCSQAASSVHQQTGQTVLHGVVNIVGLVSGFTQHGTVFRIERTCCLRVARRTDMSAAVENRLWSNRLFRKVTARGTA